MYVQTYVIFIYVRMYIYTSMYVYIGYVYTYVCTHTHICNIRTYIRKYVRISQDLAQALNALKLKNTKRNKCMHPLKYNKVI